MDLKDDTPIYTFTHHKLKVSYKMTLRNGSVCFKDDNFVSIDVSDGTTILVHNKTK